MFEIVGREEQVFEQWEQGVTLSNPCMKAGDEVIFRNSSGATYVMIAGASGVEVPNRLLQMTCNILVDLEQGKEQHNDCQTVFEVNPADKPDDYVYVDNTIRKEEAQPSGGGGGGAVIYNYDNSTEILTDENGNEVTVEQAIKDAFNVFINDGYSYLRPISVEVGDGYVVFGVKPMWDDEYVVGVGALPR